MDQPNIQDADADAPIESGLKAILANLDRKSDENQKLRIKHYDNPAKFASSETELYASLNDLQNLATTPEIYRNISTKKVVTTLLNLISHENTDIAGKVIHMLLEFTDIETDSHDETEVAEKSRLIKSLLQENVIGLLVTNLNRLDETNDEESLAINRSLNMIDNMIDHEPTIAEDKSINALLKWMVSQLSSKKDFNSIKNSIIELLSTLLIRSTEIGTKLVELGGMDALLQQVALYRRRAPETGDEHEYLEQMFDCLRMTVLESDENRNLFFEEEGVDLIIVILREKREAIKQSNIKLCVLKLFSQVLVTGKDQDSTVTQCSERFVEALGLGVLLPIFMNPKLLLNSRTKRSDYRETIRQVEEHTASIILALLMHCRKQEYLQRVLIKFAEGNFSKFLRLIELHEKYLELIQSLGRNDDQESPDETLDFIIETVDYIILLICFLSQQFEVYDPTGGETFVNFIKKLLSQKPELNNQIELETMRHIDMLAPQTATFNSLQFLLEEFTKLSS